MKITLASSNLTLQLEAVSLRVEIDLSVVQVNYLKPIPCIAFVFVFVASLSPWVYALPANTQ